MNIWIENYLTARKFVPPPKTLAIRIFDPGARPYKSNMGEWDNCKEAPFNREAYDAIIEDTFSDINLDQPYPDDEKENLKQNPNIILFSQEKANSIITKFVQSKEKISSIMVHCNAGLSRSVAVANALNDKFAFNAKFMGRAANLQHTGNSFVYRLLMEC